MHKVGFGAGKLKSENCLLVAIRSGCA